MIDIGVQSSGCRRDACDELEIADDIGVTKLRTIIGGSAQPRRSVVTYLYQCVDICFSKPAPLACDVTHTTPS